MEVILKKCLTDTQIEQLKEIDAQDGIHREVDEFIYWLTHRQPDDALARIREIQARRLWNYRLTPEPYMHFSDYLAGIPALHDLPKPQKFNRPILVDPRIDMEMVCDMLRIHRGEKNLRFIDRPPRVGAPYWMWCHDGRQNRGISPDFCRETRLSSETGLTVQEGLFLFAQDRSVTIEHFLDLTDSFAERYPSMMVCLGKVATRVALFPHVSSTAHHLCGAPGRFTSEYP